MKIMERYQARFILLLALCVMTCGCALIQIPLTILNQVLNIVKQLPMPPPGVF